MDTPTNTYPDQPVATGVDRFGDWMTVQEAVTYCQEKGLNRTPKTVRKWAMRSHLLDPWAGDVVAKSQDTENGFRWLIERSSLDVKIAQELEFEERKRPGAFIPNLLEPVQTGEDDGGELHATSGAEKPVGTDMYLLEPVHTEPHPDIVYVKFLEKQLDRAHQQIDVKDRQIDALLERDRETNILIQGLQSGMTKLLQSLPGSQHKDFRDAA